MAEKQLIIRRATLADAALIAELGARTFAAAFAADNTPEDIEHYLNSNFSEDRILEQLSDSSSTFLLAYEHDEVELLCFPRQCDVLPQRPQELLQRGKPASQAP